MRTASSRANTEVGGELSIWTLNLLFWTCSYLLMTDTTKVLSFNEDDATRILSQVTSSTDFLTIPTSEFKKRHWERESRRLASYELHAVTLAEYHKLSRIPRGMRVHLRPTFFVDDPQYCADFERIINKCSLDLILLTVERLQKAITELKEGIDTTQLQLQDSLNSEEFAKLKETVEKYTETYRKETQEKKRSKFLRDGEDYLLKRVYRWQDTSLASRPGYRGRYRPGNQYSSSSGSESNESQATRPFPRRGLGRRPPRGSVGRAESIGGTERAVPLNITTRSQVGSRL